MVGYATLYGDHAGFTAPLADLWKHQVYALGRYLNREVFKREVIPKRAFEVHPSAELSESQNPEAGGGDPLVYDYHDKLFERWMQSWERSSPEEILEWYEAGTLETQLGLERTSIRSSRTPPTSSKIWSAGGSSSRAWPWSPCRSHSAECSGCHRS